MTYNSTVLADSPAFYAPFTSSSLTNTGSSTITTVNSGGTSFVAGIDNTASSAVSLSGSTSWVQYSVSGGNTLLNSGVWSVETWFKKANTTDANGYYELINIPDTTNGNDVVIYGNDNTGHVALWYNFRGSSKTKITGPLISDTNWHHAVGTSDGTTVRFYVDSVLIGTTGVASTGNYVTSTPIWLGAYGNNAGNENWHGVIDEPAIYTTALSQARVNAHYTAGGGVIPNVTVTPPVFNAGSLTTVAPSVQIIVPNDTVTVPVFTASLAAPAPVVAAGTGVTVTGPTMALSLAIPSANFISPQSTNYSVSGNVEYGVGGTANANMAVTSSSLHPLFFNISGVTIPAGKQFSEAYLDIADSGANGSALTVNVAYLTKPYASAGLTDYTVVGTATITGTGAESRYSVDIGGVVSAWIGGAAQYGIALIPTSVSGGQHTIVGTNDTSGYAPSVSVMYTTPPTPVTVTPPAMTLALNEVAPVVATQSNISNSVPVATASLVVVAPGVSVSGNKAVSVPVINAGSVTFVGGTESNPDYFAAVSALPLTITMGNVNEYIAYDATIAAAPFVASMETEGEIAVDLTTNRLTVAPPMTATLKWVGIYTEESDWYLSTLASELQPIDNWYKMDEISGTVAVDSTGSGAYNTPGIYHGTPAFSVDGPQLRKAVRFNGTTDYLETTWTDKTVRSDASGNYALSLEFSIRTTQQSGVLMHGVYGENKLELQGGMLVFTDKNGESLKVRKVVSDGEWHHVVIAIPQNTSFNAGTYDQNTPSFVTIDGATVLVRYNSFLVYSGGGGQWIPATVMASNDGTGFVAGDMDNLVIRVGTYVTRDLAQYLYYAWSNSTLLPVEPMTVSLDFTPPFKVRGNTKKMLAVSGLPWGYGADSQPINTYLSTLSGMIIENLARVAGPYLANSSALHTYVYPKVKAFAMGEYLVYPVSITGAPDQSADGLVDPDASFAYEDSNGVGAGGFLDDATGLPRFINLQTDIAGGIDQYDVVTVVNYPWVTPDIVSPVSTQFGYGAAYPADGQLNQHNMGLSGFEWTEARDALRDSILQAAYDGLNLWIGEYHMAMHLGFIQGYDVHDRGFIYDDHNLHARDLDVQHGLDTSDYLGLSGHFINDHQTNTSRRIVALVPGLTDLPTAEYGDLIQGQSIDRWKANGDFVAYDVVQRPNGLQLEDTVHMSLYNNEAGLAFGGVANAVDVAYTNNKTSYGYFNGSSYNEGDVGADGGNAVTSAFRRFSVFSAHPDGIAGTVVAREQLGWYGNDGAWIDNPYKDNAITIAAEVGTVVRGRAIAGRAFIELMETNITPTHIGAHIDKTVNISSISGKPSTWDYDSRRNKETILTVANKTLSLIGGSLSLSDATFNYMSYDANPVHYFKRETMHNRGLNWLAQAPTVNAGDVNVYTTAIDVSLTTPAPTFVRTANPTIQVNGAMTLRNMEIRQPQNYLDGTVEEYASPMELSLDVRGTGIVVQAPVMSLTLTMPAPAIQARTEIITVFIDGDSAVPTPLFLKEDD